MQPLLLSQKHLESDQWSELRGCSLPLVLAELCKTTSGVKLIVAPHPLAAAQLLADLSFFLGKEEAAARVLLFPDWETLPYDRFSPHQDIISERLSTLSRLQQTTNAIVVTAVSTLMHRLCPPNFLTHYGLVLKEGQTLQIHSFREQLQQAGYRSVNKVLEHGEFAVRGALIDLYPMGSGLPFRIELFDDVVDSLRRFDPETQRTIEKISAIDVLPAREMPMNDESIALFRRAYRAQFPGNPSQCPLYESVSDGQFPSGIEYYLPLFFEKTATFFDYLPKQSRVCLVGNIHEYADTFFQELTTRYDDRKHDLTRPLLPPQSCYLNPAELGAAFNQYTPLRVYADAGKKKSLPFQVTAGPELPAIRQAEEPLEALARYIQSPNHRTLLVVESAGRREVLMDLLKASRINPTIQHSWQGFVDATMPVQITVGPLQEGVELEDLHLSIVVESQLFGEQRTPQRRRQQKSVDPDLIIRDLVELRVGVPVVHIDFGIGRYLGLQTLVHQDMANEFLVLAYAGDDKIYVPVTSLHLISRYTGGDTEHAPLHRLGTDKWQKDKRKALEKTHDLAIELLDIYAKREAAPGHVYTCNLKEYERFASGFPFDETPDQTTAIHQIIADLQSPRPMDRLICGDVGFGKTEVAMRAAFLAVLEGKQVCVLVPTTLLAGQHLETFRDRFADFPIHIDLLSRFRSAKETTAVIQSLREGRVDIVIGTHKLFQKDIQFRELGLLIIDEEHRFGVKQKEHIKALRTHVDILSMTATPIPRTLNMAMAGIRDISLITTPPAKRLAIKTFWQEKNDVIIREALLREILRGGQVFYLHNNVDSMLQVVQTLQQLVPEAKIQSAHGQMRERALEQIMSDFYHHRFNVLVCTTIIENGIDIPTANTILIERADTFGLAQLHQLRGRVGRSHHQAYAYLLTPPEQSITPDAVKRLEAIVSLEELGAGFTLATHDLEIRGAGELLGEDQSGNMHAVGFTLFMEMLDRAVSDLKSKKTPELAAPMHHGPEIDLQISTILPESYIGDIHTRLILYKRISHANTPEQLQNIHVELIDRFGLLPDSVKHLLKVTELKQLATTLGILRIISSGTQGKIEFHEQPNINAQALIQLIQVHAKRYKLNGPSRLQFTLLSTQPTERISEITALLMLLRG